MDTIEIDTKMIDSNANDIKLLVGEIKEVYRAISESINLLEREGRWYGTAVERFVKSVSQDINNVDNFIRLLNEYSTFLSDYAYDYNEILAKLKIND